jgi:hypothetical protein
MKKSPQQSAALALPLASSGNFQEEGQETTG